MTIAEMREYSKKGFWGVPTDVLLLVVCVLAVSAAFGLGILAGKDLQKKTGAGKGVWIEEAGATSTLPAAVFLTEPQTGLRARLVPAVTQNAVAPAPIPLSPGGEVAPSTGKFVASKNGKKYYLPSCSGALRIKESNRVWFTSVSEATTAGYSPATNCPGL